MHTVSGGDNTVELTGELQAASTEQRKTILDELQSTTSEAEIPACSILAMKADFNIPWNKLRVMRGYTSSTQLHVTSQMD